MAPPRGSLLLSVVLLCSIFAATSKAQATSAPTPYPPQYAQYCDAIDPLNGGTGACQADPFLCQFRYCNLTTNRCSFQLFRTGGPCYDWRNETNHDVCEFGTCVGSMVPSVWVKFQSTEGRLDLPNNRNYAFFARQAIINFFNFTDPVTHPGAGYVNVRTCIELKQEPPCSLFAFTSAEFKAGEGALQANNTGLNSTIFFEFIDGDGESGQDLAQRIMDEVNSHNSPFNVGPTWLWTAEFATDPRHAGNAVPQQNEFQLAVEVGIGTLLFLIIIGACFVLFAAKASGEIGGYEGTESTASMVSSADSSSGM